jgi:hypothetical protein
MDSRQHEIDRRKTAALTAIKRSMGAQGNEDAVDLFISHHLAEIDEAYWKTHLGTSRPEAN